MHSKCSELNKRNCICSSYGKVEILFHDEDDIMALYQDPLLLITSDSEAFSCGSNLGSFNQSNKRIRGEVVAL